MQYSGKAMSILCVIQQSYIYCFSADLREEHWYPVTKLFGPKLSVFTVDISVFISEPSS